jgi:Uma2 family endonuclease
MSVVPATAKLTYEDYCLLPEDGKRHEIIDGEHFVSPAPSLKHQSVSMNLSVLLARHSRLQHGRLFAAPVDVLLSEHDIVQPDLVYVTPRRAAILTTANLQGPPDLVIEIVSESTRRNDVVRKRKLYERAEVAEYWIVDPEVETVSVYRRSGDRLERTAELSLEAGEALTSPLFPNLEIPLAEVFA